MRFMIVLNILKLDRACITFYIYTMDCIGSRSPLSFIFNNNKVSKIKQKSENIAKSEFYSFINIKKGIGDQRYLY